MDSSIILLILIAAAALWGSYALYRRPRVKAEADSNSGSYPGAYAGGPDFPRHHRHDGDGNNDSGGDSGGGDGGGGGGD